MTTLLLSIGVLTRNRWDALDRCLSSLQEQARRARVPIVVLVNGSDDDSAFRVESAYPEVFVHDSSTNLGCPVGRNLLNDVCRSEWVAYVDDDGTVGSGFVDTLLAEIARALPDCAVIAGNVVDVEVNPDEVFPEGRAPTFKGGICAIRSSDFRRIGGYHDDGLRQGEETEFSVKLHDAGLTIHRSSELILFHPIRRDTESRREAMRTGMRQSLLTGVKYCPWWMLPFWIGWKLVIYLRVALLLRAPLDYLRTIGEFVRKVPRARRARRPVKARAILASSGRFSPSMAREYDRR